MNRIRLAAIGACALLACLAVMAQTARPAPDTATAAKPADEPVIPYPDWLFPIHPDSLLPPPKTPPKLEML